MFHFPVNAAHSCETLGNAYFHAFFLSLLRRKADPVYSEPLNVSGLSWRLKVYPVSFLLLLVLRLLYVRVNINIILMLLCFDSDLSRLLVFSCYIHKNKTNIKNN